MLFAEESAARYGSAITAISMVVTAIVGLCTTIAGMSYAAERRDMKTKIEALTADHRKCEEAHQGTLAELQVVRQKCEDAEHQAAVRDGVIAGINELVEGLKQELKSVRALVYNRTTSHVE